MPLANEHITVPGPWSQISRASSETFAASGVKKESKERWVEDLEVKQKDGAAVMWLGILVCKILGKLLIGSSLVDFLLSPMSQPPFESSASPALASFVRFHQRGQERWTCWLQII